MPTDYKRVLAQQAEEEEAASAAEDENQVALSF